MTAAKCWLTDCDDNRNCLTIAATTCEHERDIFRCYEVQISVVTCRYATYIGEFSTTGWTDQARAMSRLVQ